MTFEEVGKRMRFIDIEITDYVFRANLLETRSPHATEAVWNALPFEGRAAHGTWSGAIFRMLEHAPVELTERERGIVFQYPGLVSLEPNVKELAICYGQGRLYHPTALLAPLPIAEIGGDLTPLVKLGHRLQFEGATPISVRASVDQDSPLEPPPAPKGRQIEIELGTSVSVATLLENVSPHAATAFAELLPAQGRATNTYSGGPLTRFWNDHGGPEGETPLEVDNLEQGQTILYPSYIYYLNLRPWRGIRIPREATVMGGAMGGNTRLVPIARFQGDWSAFRDQAERIVMEGAKPMAIRFR
jgi:hypothetical protein